METFDSHDSFISNTLIEEKIEWVPLSLTLVEYPKGNWLLENNFNMKNYFVLFCITNYLYILTFDMPHMWSAELK